jgi:acyl-coenzyme A thioesterase PaaI-like protein
MTDEEIRALFVPAPSCSKLLGWRLLARDQARGWVSIGFDATSEFLNPAGRVQGGILAAMLDDTMGPAVLVKSGGSLYPSSIDMNVSFLSAAKPGHVECDARTGRTRRHVAGGAAPAARHRAGNGAASPLPELRAWHTVMSQAGGCGCVRRS